MATERKVMLDPPAHMRELAAGVQEILSRRHPKQTWIVEVKQPTEGEIARDLHSAKLADVDVRLHELEHQWRAYMKRWRVPG